MSAIPVFAQTEAGRKSWIIPLAVSSITVPVLLGSVSGIEFNLAHLLLPVAVFAILSSVPDRLAVAFIASGVCGLLSIAVAHHYSAGNLIGNFAELILFTMAAPALLFVGRELPIKPVTFWGAVFSAVFLLLATLPLLLTGEPVRAMYLLDTPGRQPGSEFINIHLLGLPVFATYGVNSIAPLFCIQAALLCGGIASTKGWLRVLFALGLACAVFLVVGSNSRSAQGTMVLLAIASLMYCVWRRERAAALLMGLAAASALFVSATREVTQDMDGIGNQSASESRLMKSANRVFNVFGSKPRQNKPKLTAREENLNEIATGRVDLWLAVASEVSDSPIVGNGFSGFGRFNSPEIETGENTTAHNYYLNLLWKGGILFLVPFAAFAVMAVRRAWDDRERSPQYFFAATAVVLTALLPSLFWDILIIPSAGALAWFLLGSLGANRGLQPDDGRP